MRLGICLGARQSQRSDERRSSDTFSLRKIFYVIMARKAFAEPPRLP